MFLVEFINPYHISYDPVISWKSNFYPWVIIIIVVAK